MSEHTPTRWFVGQKARNGYKVCKANPLLGVDEVWCKGIELYETAAFIVRACNAYEELLMAATDAKQFVEFARDILGLFGESFGPITEWDQADKVFDALRAAIAQATKSSKAPDEINR